MTTTWGITLGILVVPAAVIVAVKYLDHEGIPLRNWRVLIPSKTNREFTRMIRHYDDFPEGVDLETFFR